jgi:hypothetical protein
MRKRPASQSLPRRRGFRCFHCGGLGGTRDHIPPRVLLVDHLPKNPTTIPSCRICNEQLGLDEQYLMFAIATCSFNSELQTRLEPDGDLNRALKRHAGLARAIEASRIEMETGAIRFALDLERVKRVSRKLCMGLYYRRYGAKLNYNEIEGIRVVHNIEASIRFHPLALTERFKQKAWDVIQPGVFEFLFVDDSRESGRLRCLINMHETIGVECTCPRPSSSPHRRRFPHGPTLFDR